MKESVRRAFNAVNKAFQIESWIENILILLGVLSFFVLYRGWLYFHLH
jgi:hypothetical protein